MSDSSTTAPAALDEDALGGLREALSREKVTMTVVDDHTVVLHAFSGNSVVSYGGGSVVVVDCLYAELAEKLGAAIATLTDEPLAYAIPTHFHFDHAGGTEYFAEHGAVIVGTHKMRERGSKPHTVAVMAMASPPLPDKSLPTITFEGSLVLRTSNEVVDLHEFGASHTDTDVVVFLRGANLVHAGDIIVNADYLPFADTNADGNVLKMLEVVDQVIDEIDEGTVVVPGHGPLLGYGELVALRQHWERARMLITESHQRGTPLAEVLANNPLQESAVNPYFPPSVFVTQVYQALDENDDSPAGPTHHNAITPNEGAV